MAGLADLFSAEDFQTKGKKSDAQKKNEKKKDGTQKDVRYPLPARVCTGHIRCVLDGSEFSGKTVSEDEVKKKVRREFPELAGIDIGLVKFDNAFSKAVEALERKLSTKKGDTIQSNVPGTDEEEALDFASAENGIENDLEDDDEDEVDEVSDESDASDDEDDDIGKEAEDLPGYDRGCWIKLEIHYKEMQADECPAFPVTVKVGSVSQEYGDGFDSLQAVREHWVSLHPEYEGCRFHYDEKQALLIPFMYGENEIKGKKYKLPLTVGYLGMTEYYEAEDFGTNCVESVTMQQVRELYAKKYPEFENAIFAYHAETGHMFPVVSFKKKDKDMLYSVPVKIRGGGFILELESADFGGKTEVSMETVRKALEAVYLEFSEERTEMIYDERGFVIPVLKGSRKGYKVTGLAPDRLLMRVRGRNGKTYRIEKNSFGCFDCREDGEEVDFRLSAPKIPGALLCEIIDYFKEHPDREAAVQVFYDEERRRYELYYPIQKADAVSVVFERSAKLEEKELLVMDVHSHNRMDAFFSSVDDNDEKGTRLYLVIGRIDKDKPMWRMRAGIAGHYKELCIWDVFTKKGAGHEL